MLKEFARYDKTAVRTVYVNTDAFNELLTKANADVKVIPRDEELSSEYNCYRDFCKITNDEPMTKQEYEDKIFSASCSFDCTKHDNVPADVLLTKALGVKRIEVRYAEDRYGKATNDVLVINYLV